MREKSSEPIPCDVRAGKGKSQHTPVKIENGELIM